MTDIQSFIAFHASRPVLGLFLALGLVVTMGCAGFVPVEDSINVVEQHQPDDIPAPFGFDLDPNSWSYLKFQDAPLPMRSVEVIYWGDRPITEISSWYKQQMPIHGWEFVSDSNDAGETQLRYSKNDEYAEVLVRRMPDQNGEYYVTRLIVRIGVDS
jgi:hypothetical protein